MHTAAPEHILVAPRDPNGTGVLVISGSSGRVERDRATVLAGAHVTALSHRWFGGEGQPPGINEVPLETLAWGVDLLFERCDRVVLMGTSKGAEAVLLYAADDPRVDAVVALSPGHVAWANVGPGHDGAERPCRSSWTRGGMPVPFVPYDDDFEVPIDPSGAPTFLSLYRHNLERFAAEAEAATIPVERIFADVLLVAGGDDHLWPSLDSARAIEARRAAYGLPTTVVTHPAAGHRVLLPGEPVLPPVRALDRGGSDAADRALGELAWPEILRILALPA